MKRIGYIDGRRIAGFTFAGASALNGIQLDINDVTTISSGNNQGVFINYISSGVKTGGEINPLVINCAVTAHLVGNVNLASLYLAITSGKNVGNAGFLSAYAEDIGSGTIGNVMLIDLMRVITNLAGTRDAFVRFRNMGAVAGKSGIYLEGYPNIVTNLFTFSHPVPPFINAVTGGSEVAKIQVNTINPAVSYFIPLKSA